MKTLAVHFHCIKELSIDRISIWSKAEIHFSNGNLSFIFQIGYLSKSQTEIQKLIWDWIFDTKINIQSMIWD